MVSVMVSTCRKEAQDKRKQFPLDRRSLSTVRNKVFPKKVFPLISVMPLPNFKNFNKALNKRIMF